jgi:prepilin peptidase CpaA
MPDVIEIVLLIVITAATFTDLRTHQIPNAITVPAAVTGLALNATLSGWHGAVISVEGALLGIGIFLVFFLIGGMGAGDVKLFGAVGSLVGPHALLLVFVFTGLVGGVSAAVLALWRGNLRGTLPYGAVIAGGTLMFLIL